MKSVNISEKGELKILENLLEEGVGVSFSSLQFGLTKHPYTDNGQDKTVKVSNINLNLKTNKVEITLEANTLSQTGTVLIKESIILDPVELGEFIKIANINSQTLASIIVNRIVNDMEVASKVLDDNGDVLDRIEPYLPPREN